MRCVHYIPGIRLEQGGVVRAVLDWCKVLSARGHEMKLITYTGPDVPQDWLDGTAGRPHAVFVDAPTPAWNNRLNSMAIQTAEPIIAGADLLHLHGPWLNGNLQM